MRREEPGQLGRWVYNALDDLVGFSDVECLRCFQGRVGCLDSLMSGGPHYLVPRGLRLRLIRRVAGVPLLQDGRQDPTSGSLAGTGEDR